MRWIVLRIKRLLSVFLQGFERLGGQAMSAQQHMAKAVVQTGERPDFERATSSGAPARPGPITSGMPPARAEHSYRATGSYLDSSLSGAVAAQHGTQVRSLCL